MKLYRIKNWEDFFEKSDSKKAKNMVWVAVPTKHDGLSFRRTMARKDGLALLGSWLLIVQLAAKTQPVERRGYLERDGVPMSSGDMFLSTGASAESFEHALEYFSSNLIGWIESEDIDVTNTSESILTSSRRRQDETPATIQYNTIHNNTTQCDDIVDYWNSKQELPKIIKLSDERKKHLRQRLKDKWWIENWSNAIDRICNSDFCLGKIPRNDGKRAWNANFEWFIKPSSAINIMEGKYDNKANIQGGTLKLTKEQEDEQARIAML